MSGDFHVRLNTGNGSHPVHARRDNYKCDNAGFPTG